MTFGSYITGGIRCALVFLFATAVLPATTYGQESGREWRSSVTSGVYQTQLDVEKAIQQTPGYEGIRSIKGSTLSENEISYTYWKGILQPNVSMKYSGTGSLRDSEAEAVQDIVLKWNTRSTERGCTPNTRVQAYNNWPAGEPGNASRGYDVYYIEKVLNAGCITQHVFASVSRRLITECPSDMPLSNGVCVDNTAAASVKVTTSPLTCDACSMVGNPVDVSTGDKFEPEPDFDLGWVAFTRYYHSGATNVGGGFGYGWTHSHNIRLAIGTGSSPSIGLIQGDGAQIPFRKLTTDYESTTGTGDRVVKSGDWKLYRSGSVATFGATGLLLRQDFEDGRSLTYAYDKLNRLTGITHSTGRSLRFDYDTGVQTSDTPIAAIIADGLLVAAYVYTSTGQLDSVTYPGPTEPIVRTYHYEDARFPFNLTGITAEDNRRFSTFAYDEKGRVTSSQHAGGVDKTELAYSAQGGAVVTDSLSHQSDYGLTPVNVSNKPRKVSDVSDNQGVISRIYYDESVDFRRRLDTFTDRNGIKTKHNYGSGTDTGTGAAVSIYTTLEAFGLPEQRNRDERRLAATNRILVAKSGDSEIRYTRNARLQPVAIAIKDMVSGLSRTTTLAYCEDAGVTAGICPRTGLLTSIDGPRSDVTDNTLYAHYLSDESTCAASPVTCPYRKGDLWKITNALGQVTETLKYDFAGRVLSVKDDNGVITDYDYHPRGWLTARKVRGADAAVETDDAITQIEYWPTGLVKKIIQPDGASTSYAYDAAQRLTDIADNTGNTIHYTLDNAGNRTKEDTKDAGGLLKRTLSRVYNQLGQMQTQKDAVLNPTNFTYDANGNTDIVTDALGRVIDNNYDPLNRLSRTLQDVGGIAAQTQFAYDAQDNLTKVTDPKGLNTNYTYNGLGDLTQLVSPDTGTTSYAYDSAGNRISKIDANDPESHTYLYDALNRLTSIFYSTTSGGTSPDVQYTYDIVNSECTTDETFAKGRLTTTRAEATLKYCYDRFGNLTRKIQSIGGKTFVLRYSYTKTGQLRSVTYPDGAVADYIRDAQGRVTEVGVTRTGGTREILLHQASYHPFGPVAGWTYGNGRQLLRPLNQNYQPTAIHDATSGGLSVGFLYDPVGNLTQLTPAASATPLVKFDYDALSRLTTFKDGPTDVAIESYAYDATGNRQSFTNASGTQAYTYPSTSHRLSQVGATVRTYDAVGNTTSIGGTAREFGYSQADRLSSVKQGGVETMQYGYNALGERVVNVQPGMPSNPDGSGGTPSVSTYFAYDEAGHWLGEYDDMASAVQQVVWLDDLPVGLIANNQLYYIEPDHLGTPRVVIEVLRDVPVWTWDLKSEAFGNSVPNQDPDGDSNAFVFDMRFPGQRYDASTGLNYNYFRDYDTSTGRYAESDPIGLQGGFSTYSYVVGNPNSLIDPLGLDSIVTYQNMGFTTYYDNHGNYVASWPSRSDVARNSKPGAAGPYRSDNVYPSNGPHHNRPDAYGPNDILKTDDPRGRWIHGGGTGLPYPQAPRQGWKPTLGCTRMQNEDIQELVDLVRAVRSVDPKRVISYQRLDYVRPKIVPIF